MSPPLSLSLSLTLVGPLSTLGSSERRPHPNRAQRVWVTMAAGRGVSVPRSLGACRAPDSATSGSSGGTACSRGAAALACGEQWLAYTSCTSGRSRLLLWASCRARSLTATAHCGQWCAAAPGSLDPACCCGFCIGAAQLCARRPLPRIAPEGTKEVRGMWGRWVRVLGCVGWLASSLLRGRVLGILAQASLASSAAAGGGRSFWPMVSASGGRPR